jgi:hypothetical protein
LFLPKSSRERQSGPDPVRNFLTGVLETHVTLSWNRKTIRAAMAAKPEWQEWMAALVIPAPLSALIGVGNRRPARAYAIGDAYGGANNWLAPSRQVAKMLH